MDTTPKHPALEQRPDLKGYTALFCLTCGNHLVTQKPSSASAARCAAHPEAHRRIHALDEPCILCVAQSNQVREELQDAKDDSSSP